MRRGVTEAQLSPSSLQVFVLLAKKVWKTPKIFLDDLNRFFWCVFCLCFAFQNLLWRDTHRTKWRQDRRLRLLCHQKVTSCRYSTTFGHHSHKPVWTHFDTINSPVLNTYDTCVTAVLNSYHTGFDPAFNQFATSVVQHLCESSVELMWPRCLTSLTSVLNQYQVKYRIRMAQVLNQFSANATSVLNQYDTALEPTLNPVL